MRAGHPDRWPSLLVESYLSGWPRAAPVRDAERLQAPIPHFRTLNDLYRGAAERQRRFDFRPFPLAMRQTIARLLEIRALRWKRPTLEEMRSILCEGDLLST